MVAVSCGVILLAVVMTTQYSPHTNVYRPREEGRLLVNGNEHMAQFVSDLQE